MNNLALTAAVTTVLFALAVILLAPKLHASYKRVLEAEPGEDAQNKQDYHVKWTRRYMASFLLCIVSFVVVLFSAIFVKMEMQYYVEATVSGVALMGMLVAALTYSGKDADTRDEWQKNRPQWKPNRAERRAAQARARRRKGGNNAA